MSDINKSDLSRNSGDIISGNNNTKEQTIIIYNMVNVNQKDLLIFSQPEEEKIKANLNDINTKLGYELSNIIENKERNNSIIMSNLQNPANNNLIRIAQKNYAINGDLKIKNYKEKMIKLLLERIQSDDDFKNLLIEQSIERIDKISQEELDYISFIFLLSYSGKLLFIIKNDLVDESSFKQFMKLIVDKFYKFDFKRLHYYNEHLFSLGCIDKTSWLAFGESSSLIQKNDFIKFIKNNYSIFFLKEFDESEIKQYSEKLYTYLDKNNKKYFNPSSTNKLKFKFLSINEVNSEHKEIKELFLNFLNNNFYSGNKIKEYLKDIDFRFTSLIDNLLGYEEMFYGLDIISSILAATNLYVDDKESKTDIIKCEFDDLFYSITGRK